MDGQRERIRRLMIAVNRIDGLYYVAARRSGAKENTLSLLYALSDGRQHSQKQICADWLIPRTTINTVVRECVEAGYVTLTAMGRREKAVSLTDSGRAYAQALLEPVMRAEQRAMERTLEGGSDDFVSELERFAAHLDEAFAQIHTD